jgi:ABC-type sulfate transport system permease subunit
MGHQSSFSQPVLVYVVALLVVVLVVVLVVPVLVVVLVTVAAATDHAFFRCDHLVYTLVNLPLQTIVLVKKPLAA